MLLFALSGCSAQDSRTIGIGASDVQSIEVYLYTFSDDPSIVTRSEVVARWEIEELINTFTDIPTDEFDGDQLAVYGQRAAGLRFHLRDGTVLELTQVFLLEGDGASIVFLPDGEVVHSDSGYPIGDYGTPAEAAANEVVDGGERPEASLAP